MKRALLWLRRHPLCFRKMAETYGMPSLREGLRAFVFEWKSGV